MLTKLWEQNKRFLLLVGSGLVVFLILNGAVNGCLDQVDGPKGLYARVGQLEKEVRALHKELNPRYGEARARLEDYRRHEEALRADIELPPEPELTRFDAASPLIQFNQAVDRTWGEALEKANRASIPLPEKLGPEDFWIEQRDDRPEYEGHYAYLGIVRRALGALIDAGVAEIGKPLLEDEDWLPIIEGNEQVACVLRSVRFKVLGSYDSVLRVLKSLQEPGKFLQVSVRSLARQTGSGDERLLRGELEFVAIRLVDMAAGGAPGKATGPGKGGKRKP